MNQTGGGEESGVVAAGTYRLNWRCSPGNTGVGASLVKLLCCNHFQLFLSKKIVVKFQSSQR